MMRRVYTCFLAFFLFLGLILTNAYAQSEKKGSEINKEKNKKIIAEVNGQVITTATFEKLLQGRTDPQVLLDQIIAYVLLSERAQKGDFHVPPEVEEQLKVLKEQQLALFLYNKEVEEKSKVTDQDLDKLMKETDKYKVNFQQIVVKSYEEAEEIIKDLKNNKDFNELAKNKSIAKNASKGGQIGYVIPNSGYFEGEISEKDEGNIFQLKDNEVSLPIKSREGYAVFKAVSRKELSSEEMESRKNFLRFKLQREKTELARDSLLDRLRSKAKIENFDKNIKALEKAEKLDQKSLDMVLAKVDQEDISVKDILPPQRGEYGYQQNTPYLKQPNLLKEMINEKVNNILFLNEAKRLKLDKSEDFKQMFDLFRAGILGQAYALEYVKDLKVTDKELKAFYEENIERFKDLPERIRVRHILFPDEEQAKKILKRLKAGEDFIKLAKEFSICPTAKNGGDLGYISRGRMAPPFEEAAFKLKKGEISDVVKTNFGYHIIKLEEHKDAGASSFNDVSYEIEQGVLFQKRDKKIKDLIGELKSKAKITINNEVFATFQASVPAQIPGMPPMSDLPGKIGP